MKKLRTSFLLPGELIDITHKYIQIADQYGVNDIYIGKLMNLLQSNADLLTQTLIASRTNAYTKAVNEADEVRDDFFIAFKAQVAIGQRGRNADRKEASERVLAVIKKVGSRLYRFGKVHKSGKLNALFSRLDQPEYQDAIALLKADELYAEFKAAHADYDLMLNLQIQAGSKTIPSVEPVRRKTGRDLTTFLNVINTLEEIDPELYSKMVSRFNVETARVMKSARAIKTRKKNGKADNADNNEASDFPEKAGHVLWQEPALIG